MKKFIAVIATIIYLNLFTPSVFAEETRCETTSGSYGLTSQTCKVLDTQVTHVTTKIDAGLGDVSFWVVAQVLTIVSIVLFGAAKVAERVYWFD